MPGYEPFLLCDFHVHTRWSDGNLTIREVVDVYGQTRRFDVIAITDHILMEKDRLARFGRLATLGYRQCSVTEDRFAAYLAEIEVEAERARRLYDLLVVPGAEITQTHLRSSKNSHIIGLNVRRFISADQPAEDILKEIRKQGAFSIACHPHHRTTRRVEMSTCYLWDHRKRLVELADVWEAANRDDLFSVTSLESRSVRRARRFSQTEAPLLVEDARAMREELGGDRANAPREGRRRVDLVPQRVAGGVSAAGGR